MGFTVIATGINKGKPFSKIIRANNRRVAFGTKKEADFARKKANEKTKRKLGIRKFKKLKIRTRIIKI